MLTAKSLFVGVVSSYLTSSEGFSGMDAFEAGSAKAPKRSG